MDHGEVLLMFRTGFVGRQFPSGLGAGSASGPMQSLDLNFTSGVLDPRITFTRAAGPATYFDNTGTMQSAGTNVPRFDYDPVSLQLRGLLIEETRTNSVRNSVNAGATAGVIGSGGALPTNWALVGGAAGLTCTISNPGVINGIQFTDFRFNGTSSSTFIVLAFDGSTQIAVTPGTTYAESFYAWLVAGTLTNVTSSSVDMRWTGGAPGVTDTNFTLGSSFARQSAAAAATTGATNIQPALAFVITNGAAIDFTIRVGAPQVETGAFPTSYIPTTGAAATRADDIATMSLGSWYNASVGSLYTENTWNGVRPSSFPRVVEMDDGTNNNIITHLVATGVGRVYSAGTAGGVQQWQMGPNVYASNTTFKMASSWSAGSQLYAINGGTPTSASAALVPGSLNILRFGRDTGNILQSMWLSRVMYWPRMLSQDELIQITGQPTLDIGFMDPPALDSRITFTRATIGTYTDIDGQLKTAASGVPRFDHDPVTRAPLGLLVEEQRTNVVTQSGNLSTGWGIGAATIIRGDIIAPDGTQSGNRLTENSANADHSADFSFTPAGNTTYCASAFVKAGPRNKVAIELRVGSAWTSGTGAIVIADLSLGAIISSSGAVASGIIAYSNGWYRIWGTATSVASPPSAICRIGLCNDAGATSYLGDGASYAYVWGAQTEAGTFPTSYTPTAASTVTRNNDVLITPAGIWYSAPAGTLVADAIWSSPITNITRLAELSDGTTSNFISSILVAASNFYQCAMTVAGSAQTTAQSSTYPPPLGLPVRVGITYTTTAHQVSVAGQAPVSVANTGVPTITTMHIGNRPALDRALNGHICRVRYWPRVLSNAELQAVTT